MDTRRKVRFWVKVTPFWRRAVGDVRGGDGGEGGRLVRRRSAPW
jgi:hypothetical protein